MCFTSELTEMELYVSLKFAVLCRSSNIVLRRLIVCKYLMKQNKTFQNP